MATAKINAFLLTILATIVMTTGQYLYKRGADRLPEIGWTLIIAVALYFLTALIVLAALRKAELSYVYPILATSFIWVSIISWAILGEILSVYNWAGIGMIFLGVALIK